MANELDTFISALQGKWATVTDINSAPDHPPEEPNVGMVVSYVIGGEPANLPAGTILHRGRSDVFVGRSDLYHDETYARPFIERGYVMFANNVTMDASCAYCHAEGYEYGDLEGTGWFVIRFNWVAKIAHAAISVSA